MLPVGWTAVVGLLIAGLLVGASGCVPHSPMRRLLSGAAGEPAATPRAPSSPAPVARSAASPAPLPTPVIAAVPAATPAPIPL